jgi:hypothetical protein
MLDVGDGAAIYVLSRAPGRPEDCADGPATQTIRLPLRPDADLCVLTGQGQLATLNITRSTSTALHFRYRLWSSWTGHSAREKGRSGRVPARYAAETRRSNGCLSDHRADALRPVTDGGEPAVAAPPRLARP